MAGRTPNRGSSSYLWLGTKEGILDAWHGFSCPSRKAVGIYTTVVDDSAGSALSSPHEGAAGAAISCPGRKGSPMTLPSWTSGKGKKAAGAPGGDEATGGGEWVLPCQASK